MMSELIVRTLSAIILLGCFFGAYLHSNLLFSLLLGVALFIILVFEWPFLIQRSFIVYLLISCCYPILPMVGLGLLDYCYREVDMVLPLYPFIISWIYDSMGYFVGKAIGVHKICPTISPGKTWEGLVGSFMSVLIGNLFLLQRISIKPFYLITTKFSYMLAFSLTITLAAFSGGMLISYLKRSKGLKDAGSLLPGHGGLLDRFDSILFVGILVWIVVLGAALF